MQNSDACSIYAGKKLNPFPLFGSGGGNSVPSGSATEEGKPVLNEGI